MCFNRVLGVTPQTLYADVLFNPLEEGLDLPTSAVRFHSFIGSVKRDNHLKLRRSVPVFDTVCGEVTGLPFDEVDARKAHRLAKKRWIRRKHESDLERNSKWFVNLMWHNVLALCGAVISRQIKRRCDLFIFFEKKPLMVSNI